jgi:LAGLIDADG endonuclease
MRSDAGSLVSREFLSAYISGYADGEGCFSVSIAPRATLAVGWEVRPSFSVSQNQDRAEVIRALQAYFGCESIRPDRSDKTLKWETRQLDDLVDRVIPHFMRYPLLSAKRRDFERFAVICLRMRDGEHRSRQGPDRHRLDRRRHERRRSPTLRRVVDLELSDSSRDEGIVCALGNGGSTRSSDLHEWSNDLGAVSTRDPVKL